MNLDDIQIFHDSHNIKLRSPFGAVITGTKVKIRLWTSKRCAAYISLINFYNKNRIVTLQEGQKCTLNLTKKN